MTETASPGPSRERNVLVAGAINTDLVARLRVAPAAGETVLGESFAVFGGGKAANQAVAAARSGAPTAMLGALGADDFGRQRLDDLRAEGIDVAAVAVLDGVSSGVALILVEEATGQNRIANVLGATARVTPAQAARVLDRVRPAVLLLTLEFPRETVAALVEAARAQGASVLLNATPDPTAGRDLLPLVDLLIVNETEAGDLIGRAVAEGEGIAAARALLDLGPATVVATLGAAGAVVARRGETVAIPAPPVEVVDTTGAGDAFCGALAARLVAGDDPVAAVRLGVAAGSLATTKAGAQPSMPRLADVQRLAATFPPA